MAGRKSLIPEARKRYTGKEIPLFCARVRIRRDDLQMTQGDLAEAIGTQKARISEIEGGNMPGSFERIVSLSRALETTPDYLFGFRDTP